MEDNAGIDPLLDRYYCGYIAAVNDVLKISFVEETEELDN